MEKEVIATDLIEKARKAWRLCRQSPQECITISEEVLKQTSPASDGHVYALALSARGAARVWTSEFDLALKDLLDSRPLLQSFKDFTTEARLLYQVYCAFYFISEYESAYRYANELLELSKKHNDREGISNAHNGLGTTYYTIGENEKAVTHLSEALRMAEEDNDQNLMARVLDGIGTAWLNLGDFEKSISFKERCLKVCRESKNQQVESYSLNDLARLYTSSKDYLKAEKYFLESLSIRKAIGFKPGEADTLLCMGLMFRERKLDKEAFPHLKQALSIAEEIGNKEVAYKAHEALANLYEESGQAVLFAKHIKLYFKLREEFSADRNKQKVKSSEMQAQLANMQQQFTELEELSRDLVKLSDLGKTITSLLTVESINKTVYEIIRQMMDSGGFGIGVYDEKNNRLEFPGYIEEDKVHDNSVYDLNDENRLAVICFKRNEEILINDFDTEITRYTKKRSAPVIGKSVNSIIYLPLTLNDKKVGVITVQSFQKNAYSQYHLNLARNLGVYCAIALENAKNYARLEEAVSQRTREVQQQKEEIEESQNSTRLLAEMGQKIISNVEFENIFKELHSNISLLMNADCFGIRIYDPIRNVIDYRFEMERGELIENVIVPLDNDNNYSVWCVKNKKDIFINDNLTEHTRYVQKINVPAGEMPHSLLFCPMLIGEKVVGVITVQSFAKNAYAPKQLDMLKTLSTYTAIALENANLIDNLEDTVKSRTSELTQQKERIEKTLQATRIIGDIGKEISASLDVEEIVSKTYSSVNKLMEASVFGIGIYSTETSELLFTGTMEKGEKLPAYSYKISEPKIATICFNNSREIVINDWESEFRNYVKEDYAAVEGDMPESMIYIPLFSKEKIIGVLTVQSFKKHSYSDYHLDLLRSLSLYIGSALENASLYAGVESQLVQLEKTQENTQLLSQIGREISSLLSAETVAEKVYESVNKLMDATIFGIGIVNEEKGTLEILGAMEKGKKLPDFNYSLSETQKLATHCVLNKAEIIINDVEKDYHKYISTISPIMVGEDPASILYIPLISKNKAIGTISVQSFEKNAYNEYHVNLLRNLALYASIAIENASLYENLEERVEERTKEIEQAYNNNRLLSQISKEIGSSLNVETIIAKVYEHVNKLMDATCFGVGLYNAEKNCIRMPGFIESGERMEDFEYGLEQERLAVWCYKNQKEIFINNYSIQYKDFIKGMMAPVSGKDSSSIIYLPLYVREKIIGVITVQSFSENAYTEYHLDILRNLAQSVASALENAQLYENMESQVHQRTAEVVKQKEQIEKTLSDVKVVSEIGKEISSMLSAEDIIAKMYVRLNELMDASTFGIGVFQPDKNDLLFKGSIEKGKKLGDFTFSLNDSKIASICFKENREIIIHDWHAEYTKYVPQNYSASEGEMPLSLIYAPLHSKNKTVGVLTVQCFRTNAYSDYHMNIIRNLSVHVGSALENAGLYEKMEEKVVERTAEIDKAYQNTKMLSQISKDITSSLSIETIISKVYESVNALMDANMFGIGLHNKTEGTLHFPGFIENSEKLENVVFNDTDDRVAVWSLINQKEVFSNNYPQEYQKYVKSKRKVVAGKESGSLIYIPLYSKGEVFGVLTVQSYETDAYTEYHLDMLRNIAHSASIAIDNAQLYENLEEKVIQRTAEVIKQKEVIEEKNKHITDSIKYA
ncbi:MAG: GAF domain-containing protein, partial [Flavobacteriales bacterium]